MKILLDNQLVGEEFLCSNKDAEYSVQCISNEAEVYLIKATDFITWIKNNDGLYEQFEDLCKKKEQENKERLD